MMFDPRWEDRCPSCSAAPTRSRAGWSSTCTARHRARLRLARADREARALEGEEGLVLSLVLVYGCDFNFGFDVTLDESVKPPLYNYRSRAEYEAAGSAHPFDFEQPIEMPGTSFLLRDGDRVFHTYSTYARGAEMTGGSYGFLNLTALGRHEDWEEPKAGPTARGRRSRTSRPEPAGAERRRPGGGPRSLTDVRRLWGCRQRHR